MNLKKYLIEKTIIPRIKHDAKEEILLELLEVLCESGKLRHSQLDDALDALLKREKKMSTGIQDGLAIPHAKISGIKDLIACMGLKPEGVDFDSLDGKPSTIFILTLSPVDTPVPHVQFLAEISQRLGDENRRTRLLACDTVGEILDTFFH